MHKHSVYVEQLWLPFVLSDNRSALPGLLMQSPYIAKELSRFKICRSLTSASRRLVSPPNKTVMLSGASLIFLRTVFSWVILSWACPLQLSKCDVIRHSSWPEKLTWVRQTHARVNTAHTKYARAQRWYRWVQSYVHFTIFTKFSHYSRFRGRSSAHLQYTTNHRP